MTPTLSQGQAEPTDAHQRTLMALLDCCEAWEPDVRVLGNVRAEDAADAIRSYLAASSAAPTEDLRAPWQPMTTAPKDGTVVRLFCEGFIEPDFNPGGSVEGFWLEDIGWMGAVWNNYQDCWDTHEDIQPTHWMPLPPAPGATPAASPVVHPAGERTASSEGTREAHAGYRAPPDDKDGASPPVQQGVVEALEKIASMPGATDEWDAVEKYKACRELALASLRPPAAVEKP